jgi:hypothetical protein
MCGLCSVITIVLQNVVCGWHLHPHGWGSGIRKGDIGLFPLLIILVAEVNNKPSHMCSSVCVIIPALDAFC